MNSADRLERALYTAVDVLMDVVGFPVDAADEYGARFAVTGPVVDRSEIPDGAYRAAIYALQVAMVGYGIMDLDADEPSGVSLEEGLAALTSIPRT